MYICHIKKNIKCNQKNLRISTITLQLYEYWLRVPTPLQVDT